MKKDKKVEEVKPKKKRKGLIMLIIFLVMLGLVGLVLKLIPTFKSDFLSFIPTTPKEFSTYYETLKKYEDGKYYKDNGIYFHAYKIEGLDNLVIDEVSHINDQDCVTIYYIKDDNVIEKVYNHQSEIKPLFETLKEEYGYYLIERVNGNLTYTLLDDIVKEKPNPYKFSVKESEDYEEKVNDKLKRLAPSEERFIRFSDSTATTHLMKEKTKKLKRELKTIMRNANLAKDTTLGDESNNVKYKLDELRKKQEEVKAYRDVVKVGYRSLKVGTYMGKIQNMDGSYSTVKVVLKTNSIVVDGEETSYYVSGKFLMVHNFEMFQIDKDDEMIYLAGTCPTLTYQG